MLTIIIPTMNRSDFLIRSLNYYADTGYRHFVSIGDSSDVYHVEKVKKTIKNLEGKLKIIYREYPGLNDVECLQQITKSLSTPYAVYVADDDFLVPSGLEKCISFLEENRSYNSANGIANVFTLHSSGPYGQFASICKYRLPSIEGDTASQRILYHLNNYSVTLFSVHRAESWLAIFKDIHSLPDRSFAGELLPCCLSVIQGKVKELDCYYLVRQDHSTRYKLPDISEWINNSNWEPSYKRFLYILSEELSKQDKISLDDSRNIIEKSFKFYLDNCTKKMIHSRTGSVARKIPGMDYIIMYIKQKLHGDYSLSTILNPSSPYHKDFMPVYRLITTPPTN